MTIEVETGSGSATAESYASVADADTYFSLRGITIWTTLVTAEKEQALRRATDYMQQTYNGRWKGLQVKLTQALDWPRAWVVVNGFGVSSETIPADIVRACIELALRAASGELLPDVGAQVTEETIGPITTRYAVGARQTTSYKAIDSWLAKFMTGGGMGSIPVVRA